MALFHSIKKNGKERERERKRGRKRERGNFLVWV
jgi:hypothetical protein